LINPQQFDFLRIIFHAAETFDFDESLTAGQGLFVIDRRGVYRPDPRLSIAGILYGKAAMLRLRPLK
jgi:hypothetical protein